MLNGPEARHGTVINAVRRAGHALRHSCLHELVVKCPVGILEPSVAMEQGVRVWIGFHGIFKGFVNQWIVIGNRKSRQRLDRHGTIVVGSCETFHHYNVQGVK